MPSADLTALVHLVGFTTGIVLYTMLAVMTLRRGASSGEQAGDPVNRIPLVAALLGLVWNVGALVMYSLPGFRIGTPSPWVTAVAFSALGFLPAVVVDSATRPVTTPRQRWLVVASYALSILAAVMQAIGASRGAVPSPLAMITLTVGYAVVLTLIAITTREQEGWQRNLTAVVLAAFAVSALHLSHDASQRDSPLAALFGHHASLPLVLVILYQDYRFAFADLFLRRALSLVAVVCLAVALHVWVAVPIATALGGEQGERLAATAVHVALWVATALLYPVIRRGVGQFVDSVLLGRLDYRHVRDDVALAVSRAETPDEILRKACAVLRPALGIRELEPRPSDEVEDANAPLVTRADGTREAIDHALVHVPTNDAPYYVIDIRGLNDGRRLMSDDVALLESVASLVARRIDAVRVTQERFDRGLREREIMQLAAEAELRSLRAQLNPHFLFNALTTIGYLLKAAPEKALGTLYQLTDLLRAILRRPPGELVSLGEELAVVESYLAIERARFEERLSVCIDVPASLRPIPILPLLVQPLVENAVKHGISPLRRGGTISISAALESVDDDRRAAPRLRITVADTGRGIAGLPGRGVVAGEGVGLRSIEQRLALHYGPQAALELTSAPGLGTRAELRLPVAESVLPDGGSVSSSYRLSV
jgi:two-component system, LytTR family, sensor kinase